MKATPRAWILGTMAILYGAAAAMAGCSGGSDGDDASGEAAISNGPQLDLTDAQRRNLVGKGTTCPFVGTALALKRLFVFGSPEEPFANIGEGPGNAAAIGNTGGGDLGEGFKIIARANHHRSPTGAEAPQGMFSLLF